MALGKAPKNLTPNQQAKVEWIAKTDPRLYRAYKLKEALRLVFYNDTVKEAKEALDAWFKWARHCRIPAFVELQKKIHINCMSYYFRLFMNFSPHIRFTYIVLIHYFFSFLIL